MQQRLLAAHWCFSIFMKNAESGGLSLTAVSLTSSYSRRHREWEEVQYYCIDYFQLYFHWTLALDHLYRQSFRDLHYLSSSSAAAINLALYLSLSFWHTMFTLIIKGHSHIKTQFAYCPINSYDFRQSMSNWIELEFNHPLYYFITTL